MKYILLLFILSCASSKKHVEDVSSVSVTTEKKGTIVIDKDVTEPVPVEIIEEQPEKKLRLV